MFHLESWWGISCGCSIWGGRSLPLCAFEVIHFVFGVFNMSCWYGRFGNSILVCELRGNLDFSFAEERVDYAAAVGVEGGGDERRCFW